MKILVAGAAGNLGSRFARHLLGEGHDVRLLVHRTLPPKELTSHARAEVCPGDLDSSQGLDDACRGCDAIVYSAGRLFAPRPEEFLHVTNVEYVRNLAVAARAAGVRRFVLMSFPHVEGETTPDRPARGLRDATPSSVHARTRLEAEHCLFDACASSEMTPVVLRVGAVYGPGILMLEAARKLMRWRLMAVWRRPTWLHLIALPDLLSGIQAAVEKQGVEGIYPLCDDRPITLQDFLDRMARELGYPRPRRLPAWCFVAAGAGTELYAAVTGSIAPLTRDFIRIGMSSSVADTSRRTELVPRLAFPTLEDGISLLHPASTSQ